jgi:predicted DNA-binding transcriptional regulator YafY
MRKTSRLLFILNTLRYKRGLAAKDLAAECGVAERTIYRDINALLGAGVPIYYDRGYKLLNHTFLPPLSFTPDELQYIYCALSSNMIPDKSGPDGLGKSILAKIISATSGLKSDILKDEDCIRIHPKITARPSFDDDKYRALMEAINKCQTTEINYESLESASENRLVDPYSLVFRNRAWYLIGYCHKRKEIRTFRFSRIHVVEICSRRFRRAGQYSVENYFRDNWNLFGGEVIEFTARFRDRAAKVILSGIHHRSEKIKMGKNGEVLYSARASGIEEIIRWLVGFGDEVCVVSPPYLIERLKNHLSSALKNYS